MLDYKRNRLDYGALLHPPEGYVMDRAVATSYSLDLEALLSIPVALFYNKNLDGQVIEDRMDIFDAIQKSSECIHIYCQRGKIKVPLKANRLFSFIEDCVTEVLPDSQYTSFHPKIWIIRYKSSNNPILYRVLIMSRNLTFDRSYDISYCLEGFVGRRKIGKNNPLSDYLKHLCKFGDFNNSDIFINDFSKVDFQIDSPFEDFLFHPSGFSKNKNPLIEEKWTDLIIISPFLHSTPLNQIRENTTHCKYLLSRREELDKIHLDDLEGFELCSFSKLIVEGETSEEKDGMIINDESHDIVMLQNIHAKLYIGDTKEGLAKWFLGSMNLTNAAWQRNEEFLLELSGIKNKIGFRSMLKLLLGDEEDLKEPKFFEKYKRENKNPIASEEFDFRKFEYALLKMISEGGLKANCSKMDAEGSNYRIRITLDDDVVFNEEGVTYSFLPFGYKGDEYKVLGNGIYDFNNIAIFHLSPFLIWKIHHADTDVKKEFITKMPISLPDNRKGEIFRSIIQNQERFMQLIQFMLGASEGVEHFKDTLIDHRVKIGSGQLWLIHSGMYEELLMAVSRDKSKFFEIEKFIRRLKETGSGDLIPEEFNAMWDIFKDFAAHE